MNAIQRCNKEYVFSEINVFIKTDPVGSVVTLCMLKGCAIDFTQKSIFCFEERHEKSEERRLP